MLPLRLGRCPSNRDPATDINEYHVAHALAHEAILRKTTKQMGVTLVGKMHECKNCSLAKGIRMSSPSKMSNGAAKILFHIFVGLGGKDHVKSIKGKKYPMITRDHH